MAQGLVDHRKPIGPRAACRPWIETQAGHGAGKPVSKMIEETADMWAFLVKVLKMKPPAR